MPLCLLWLFDMNKPCNKNRLLQKLGFKVIWVSKLCEIETLVFETLSLAIQAYRQSDEQDYFFTDKSHFLKYYLQENGKIFLEPMVEEKRDLFSA